MRSEDVARSSVLKNEFTGPVASRASAPSTGFLGLGDRVLEKAMDFPFLEENLGSGLLKTN